MITIKSPRRLKAVADLGPYEINVGALSERHVGLTVAVAWKHNTLTGRLMSVPLESRTKPLLVLRLGDFSTALHPSAAVNVIPDGYRATVVIEKREAS